MIRKYFNQALHLIRQNPLFSGFYILGTGLAISMVMLLVVIYYIKVAGIYPETNRSRMMVISDVHMQNVDDPSYNSTGLIAYHIVKDFFYNLKGTEAVSAIGTYVAGDGYAQLPSSKHRIPVVQKAVDVAFWKVFDFHFIDGVPFSESDFASGIHHIVISEEVAQRIFNTSKVVGKYLTIDFVEYKICGVVKTPSYATELSYAQVWIPYTCFPGYDKYNQYDALGAYEVVILAHSSSDFGGIKAQVDEFTRKFNVAQEKDAEIRHILTTVYAALEDKGYNPINQIVGYILSEDPTYITNHNNARTLIRKLDRDELLQTLVRSYLGK